jgi:hypothetical protein
MNSDPHFEAGFYHKELRSKTPRGSQSNSFSDRTFKKFAGLNVQPGSQG